MFDVLTMITKFCVPVYSPFVASSVTLKFSVIPAISGAVPVRDAVPLPLSVKESHVGQVGAVSVSSISFGSIATMLYV